MRTLVLFGVLTMLLLAGCAAPLLPSGQAAPNTTCRIVIEQKPVTTEQCGDVSTTEQVCGLRELPSKVIMLPKIDLCIIDGDCVGKPLSQCPVCTTAMSRCTLVIENQDPQASGTWTVTANYTIGNAGFNKEPITATIKPNESYSFDYQQIYAPGYPTNSANCNISVISKATVNDCHGETRTARECKNVTVNASVQTQVCG